MTKAVELLKHYYLRNIQENPESFIGIELEYPIVNLEQKATDTKVTKSLMFALTKELPSFEIEEYDIEGNPVQLCDQLTGDKILFEVSYNTLEFAFGKVKKIQDAEERFKKYLNTIQSFLKRYHHAIQGKGIHPYWYLNDNSAVKLPRYQMLIKFLELSKKKEDIFFHSFPRYGSFICGNQVQLDVSKENYLRVINAFNQIEAVKAFLFSNSPFEFENSSTNISRDIFWENSMHGVFEENVGVNKSLFQSEDEFFDYLSRSAMFYVERDKEIYYFEPIQVKDYLGKKEIQGWKLNGEKIVIKPREEDIQHHRSYQYQDLTKRGTVEFRSVCTQPLGKTFAPIAFHVGLLENLDKLEVLLKESAFLKRYNYDYKFLRRKFSENVLTSEETAEITDFAKDIINCSIVGLKMRGYGESAYIRGFLEKR
ncbi:hypothetical protein [Streptococcus macacae]|uniref:glutamate--cysteine ligase n=1 Tax=Streptococcus macacae NCTC 11558 TaxID=764298 RepID=G5JXU2_9STRE|nr:hypothetical protein [Streptococcus macacae]EHJ52994.1 hypothetical protein STRMA_1716 [Streptococcus macacae NCTC 11558]SUN77649.1 gamma-glutamylcysteine synthetase putative [Streptococcus macacae NCTC 11558]